MSIERPIKIYYQDKHYIVVEKPSGLFVHPFKKESNERDHLMKFVKEETSHYLYPVHRLDRPVSGPVIFALSSEAARKIQENWHLDTNIKEYTALVRRILKEPGAFNFPLQNDYKIKQEALTLYFPIHQFDDSTLVKVQIKTGRKHQIRRHFSRRCFNIIGDSAYGQGAINRLYQEKYQLERIFLHCTRLKLKHPYTQEEIDITSPLPKNLSQTLESKGFTLFNSFSLC